MSRIGNKLIPVVSGVELQETQGVITVKGPKGELKVSLPKGITLHLEEGHHVLKRENDSQTLKALHGTTRANLANAVKGVSEGFKKTLEIVGIGYRAAMRGSAIVLNVGYSHEIVIEPKLGSSIAVPNPTEVVVSGYDRQAVGETAALIRKQREPEPYNGKGIKYKGEHIIRKEGKRAGKK